MKKMIKYLFLSILSISSILFLTSCAGEKKGSKTTAEKNKTAHTETSANAIQWFSYDAAVKKAAHDHKKIFIDVYTDWCGWCKKMDKTTFEDPKIIEYMNKKFVAVKLNAESPNTTSYKGQSLTESALAVKILKANGYPTTAYLDNNESIFNVQPGYMDAPTLNKVLHFFGDDHYKTKTWDQFQLTFSDTE